MSLVKDRVSVPHGATFPGSRSQFGLFTSPVATWQECRESVHCEYWSKPAVRKSGKLVFAIKWGAHTDIEASTPRPSSEGEAYENIANLLDYVERVRMGWADRSSVHRTQHVSHCLILLSPGWLMNTISFSLLTIFLRLGPYNRPGTKFDWLLDQYLYSRETKPAIERFLSGYYHYTGPDNRQWYATFSGLAAEQVIPLLIHRSEVDAKARELWATAGRPEKQDGKFWLDACQYFRITRHPSHAR